MKRVTLRLAADKRARLQALCRRHGVSVGALLSAAVDSFLLGADAQARFDLRSERGLGKAARGVELLRKARGL
jgi:hypothetical protein